MHKASKITLSVLFTAAALLILSATGFAQPRQRAALPDSSQVSQMVDTLAVQLELDKEQKEKVAKLYFASFAEMGQARQKSGGDFRALRGTMRDIATRRDNDIKALLNDAQKKRFEKIIAEREKALQQRMRGPRGPR